MSATAAEQLRRILHLIPRLADGETHSLAEVARLARVDRAVVLQDIDQVTGSGMVRILNEEWRATAPGKIPTGTEIIVTQVKGARLIVERLEN